MPYLLRFSSYVKQPTSTFLVYIATLTGVALYFYGLVAVILHKLRKDGTIMNSAQGIGNDSVWSLASRLIRGNNNGLRKLLSLKDMVR